MSSAAGDIRIDEYDYELIPERIANFPLAERDQSKLLVCKNGEIEDHQFSQLAHHLPENSLLVLNDTRVIEARLIFQKQTGGAIEIFCLEPYEETVELSLAKTTTVKWLCLIGGASKWKHGLILQKVLAIDDKAMILSAEFKGKEKDAFIIEFSWVPQHLCFAEVLHTAGAIPLPPYIKRDVIESDKERYQTVFSKHDGSVAAPTAALHFTEKVFAALKEKNIDLGYVTLHVGAGTFQPVKSATIS
jgi:S-adenosylmethionine:tRNA ribosyltransferase-isomerase